MGRLEEQGLNGARIKPYVWWRFLDDIFMDWTGNTDEPKDFIDYLNNLHPTIKFTSDLSKTSVAFLDTTVSINNCKVSTDLYVKPTDTHQYLLSSSCHPYHTKGVTNGLCEHSRACRALLRARAEIKNLLCEQRALLIFSATSKRALV